MPAYENRSTIESVELLMSYNVGPFLPRLLDVPTHMTLYSDRSLLGEAASAASDWYAQHLLPDGAAVGAP